METRQIDSGWKFALDNRLSKRYNPPKISSTKFPAYVTVSAAVCCTSNRVFHLEHIKQDTTVRAEKLKHFRGELKLLIYAGNFRKYSSISIPSYCSLPADLAAQQRDVMRGNTVSTLYFSVFL